MEQPNHKEIQIQANGLKYMVTYGVCFFSLGLCMSQLGVLLPYMADNLGVSLAQISFLFTANSLGYLLGSAGGGRLYDHYKSHHLMLIALVLMAMVGVLIPLIINIYILLVVIFIFGLGQGMLDIGGNVNILWVFQSEASPYMNGLHFSFGFGAFVAPIIIRLVMQFTNGSIVWPYWIISILFLPSIIGLLLLRSPENPEKFDNTQQVKPAVNRKLITFMVILFFLYVGVEVGFSGWIFTYVTQLNIVNETLGSYMTSVFWGALTMGRLLSIPLAKKIQPLNQLFGNFILAILFVGVILLWPLNSTILWISSAGLGLSLSSIFPTLMALAETRMNMSGSITGLFFFGTSLGSMVLPTLLGQIFEFYGSYLVMVTLFMSIFLGLLLLIFVLYASSRVEKETVSRN